MTRPTLPTDDQLWAEPGVTYQAWAERMGTPVSSIAAAARARGWVRPRGNSRVKLLRAPCAGCGQSKDVDRLDRERRCGGCSADAPLSAVEIERRASLERRAR